MISNNPDLIESKDPNEAELPKTPDLDTQREEVVKKEVGPKEEVVFPSKKPEEITTINRSKDYQPEYVDHSLDKSEGMFILDSSEKIEYSKSSDFKKTVEMIAAKGEVLNIQLKVSNACSGDISVSPTSFSFKPYTMVSSDTKIPSSSDLKAGKYFDALVPMDEPACPNKQEICKQSNFRWVDITVPRSINTGEHYVTVSQGTDKVMIKLIIKDFTMPLIPSLPFRVPISNWSTMLGHCPKDKDGSIDSCKKNFALHEMYNKVLRENRMEPYDNAIVEDVNNKEYFDDIVSDCRNTALALPSVKGLEGFNEIHEIVKTQNASEYQKKKNINSWFYTSDEPDLSKKSVFLSLLKLLKIQKKYAPNVKTMVTTTYNEKLNDHIDIYCPVVDQWDQPGFPPPDKYKGKEVWLYSSCMAHGKCNQSDNDKGDHKKSGTPDFMIDRPAVDLFAFFAQGYKYNVQGLLYYNAGVNYSKKDPWKDLRDFGGNGDGSLLYPLTGPMNGNKGKFGCTSDAVAPSVRFKKLRQAAQLQEWMRAAPDQEKMQAEVNSLVKNTKDWSHNSSDYENLKKIAFP